MKGDLLKQVYTYNKQKAINKAAELAEKATLKSAKEQAEKKLSESTDKMKEIANMFSTSLWKLMPQSIKKYFEEYRN